MQQNRLLIVIIMIALGAGGFLFWQNQKISTELSTLKNTDLAKEVSTLRIRLQSAADAQSKLAAAEGKIKTLEATVKQARPFVDVLTAFDNWQAPSNLHILDRDTSQIDSAVSALGDSEVSNLWREVKNNFLRARQTGDFRDNDVPVLVTKKLSKLLK